MTVRDIQRKIMVERYTRATLLPNYTPRQWWECDVFELTKASYFREYEIKMSYSDYRADAKKRRNVASWLPPEKQEYGGKTKHQLLQAGDPRGPRQFYFVCPERIIEHVPGWAGLIYAQERKGHRPPWNVRLKIIKRAPILHRGKLENSFKDAVRLTAYYRFQTLFCYGKDLQSDVDGTAPTPLQEGDERSGPPTGID